MKTVYMRFPGGKKKALTLSYDDGVEQDIRLIEIMKKYGLKGTFNINSGMYASEDVVYEPGTIHRRMSKNAVTELYKNSGMEVAAHGLTHPPLTQLPANFATEIFMKIVKTWKNSLALLFEDMHILLACITIVLLRLWNVMVSFMPEP